jgi:hypothetical protein
MRIPFQLETEELGKQTVTTSYADIIALEEKFSMNASDLQAVQRATWMAFLAWHALRRTGGPESVGSKTFEQWVDGLIDLADSASATPDLGEGDDLGNGPGVRPAE